MAHKNRVDPFGVIGAQGFRGAFTGNRGIIHDPVTRTLHPTRRWTSKAWIYCICKFKNRQRDVMGANGRNGGPGWTNLFFFDEASAMAAGHRPCFECQRKRAIEFQTAWSTAHKTHAKAAEMDKVLHGQRLYQGGKRLHPLPTELSKLPDGTFVCDTNRNAYLIWHGKPYQWFGEGYAMEHGSIAPLEAMLTPQAIYGIFQVGFRPSIGALDFQT